MNPGMSRATEIWYFGMQNMAPGGSSACVAAGRVGMEGWEMWRAPVKLRLYFKLNVLSTKNTDQVSVRIWTV